VQKILEKYRPIAIWLHWIIGIALIAQIGLGLYMVDIPKGTPDRAWFFNLHKSIGLTLALLILLRIVYRLQHSAPVLPSSMAQWQQLGARWSHYLLYVCMILMPVSGYIGSSFNKYGVKFWGISLPNWAWEDKDIRETFVDIHEIVAEVFIVLIALHVLAALKHLIFDKDGVFQRMLLTKQTGKS
jgi:cytochrome b561